MSIFINVIQWNADPILFQLGPFAVRWYSLLFAAGFLIGYWMFEKIFKQENRPAKDLDTLLVYMFLGTVLGARLGHCLFYDFDYYFRQNPIEIFKVWEGGLASHGAVIGILLSVFIYTRTRPKQKYFWVLDRIAITVALAGTLIRLGNFFNSEIVGIPTDGSWGVVFQRLGEGFPRVPVQLFESASYFFIFLVLGGIYLVRWRKLKNGILTSWFFILVFSARYIIEFWKEGEKITKIMGVDLNRGQVLSIPVVIMGFIMLWYAFNKIPKEVVTKKK
jgi:phosphatidylglycerol---prolipoprotein diacylglyceryl transferase